MVEWNSERPDKRHPRHIGCLEGCLEVDDGDGPLLRVFVRPGLSIERLEESLRFLLCQCASVPDGTILDVRDDEPDESVADCIRGLRGPN